MPCMLECRSTRPVSWSKPGRMHSPVVGAALVGAPAVGDALGTGVGDSDGLVLGAGVGLEDGLPLGEALGLVEGLPLGENEGDREGETDGLSLGLSRGLPRPPRGRRPRRRRI